MIGAGSGGLSFAAGAAQMGASVVLLEKHKMGGDCLNAGCVPSKALIAASKIGHTVAHAQSFGWSFSKVNVDFQKVHDHIHSVIASIAPHDSVERFEGLGVHVIREEGRFLDRNTVETEHHLIQAKRFILATGSSPFIPPVQGLDTVPFLTNESLFDLTELPQHLAVIGGGPIGIEMAQAFRRLGSDVTVLEAFKALPKDDPEITDKLKAILVNEGIHLLEGVTLLNIEKKINDIHIHYKKADGESAEIKASHILVATGRRPHIQNLNLEKAGIEASPKGIKVDDHLKTSNPKVYAIGDCTGGYQFTHVAGYHAGIAIRHSIFRLNAKVETRALPWVTYTDPELAHVGFLESGLKSLKKDYKVLSLNFSENDRAHTEKRTEGMIKVLVSPKGDILGATVLGVHAGELIYPWVIAIQNNLKISALAKAIAPYPTLNEINKKIAGQFYTDKLFSPLIKKIVKALTRFLR